MPGSDLIPAENGSGSGHQLVVFQHKPGSFQRGSVFYGKGVSFFVPSAEHAFRHVAHVNGSTAAHVKMLHVHGRHVLVVEVGDASFPV